MGRQGTWYRSVARAVADWQWIILLVALPAVLVGSPALSPVLLVFPLLWLARKIAYGRFVPETPLNIALLLLLTMVLVSVVVTYDLAFSLPKVAGVLFGLALFYAVVDFGGRSRRNLLLGVAALVVSGLGVVALGLIGVNWRAKMPFLGGILSFLPGPVMNIPGRGYPINPNELAGVLLWTAPVVLALAIGLTTRYKKMMSDFAGRSGRWLLPAIWLIAIVQSAAVLLTQSRAALLGLGAGVLLIVLSLSGRYRRLLFVLIVAALALGAFVVWQSGPQQVADNFFTQTGIDPTESTLTSLRGRSEIWSRAVYGIQDFPFTGMGMNTFREVVHILYPLFVIPPDTDIAHAHNHLLQAALDLGLPGLVAYIAVWMGAAGMLWQSWRRSPEVWQRVLTAGFAAALLAYFIYGFLDAVALGARPGFLWWWLLGLVAAQYWSLPANRLGMNSQATAASKQV